MRKYYLHDGQSQQGPFDLEELKTRNITPDTFIWCDSLPEWTQAREIDELKVLFTAAPPPFKKSTPPQFNQPLPSYYEPGEIPATKDRKPFIIGLAAACIVFITIIYFANNKTEAAEAAESTQNNTESAISTDTIATVDPNQIKLQELEEKERQRQAANEALTMKNMEFRNNWSNYIYSETNDYRVDSWGGIYGLVVSAHNGTDRILDEVIVSVDYYKENGSLYTTKNVPIYNIQPNTSGSISVPDVNRGTRIEVKISKITSKTLHFCYNVEYEDRYGMGISGNDKDPWFCK